VQLDFSAEASKRFQRVKELANNSSNAAVVRDALSLRDWYFKQLQNGNKLQVVSADGVTQEVEIVFRETSPDAATAPPR